MTSDGANVSLAQDGDAQVWSSERMVLGRFDSGAPAPGLECSVGVMAYNEEANVAHVIDSILRQTISAGKINELIVVASGCQDRTVEIVADIARHERRVRLVEQQHREGKASAINLFLSLARSPVLVMVSADTVVRDGTFEALLRNFDDPTVGMAGGHPTPVNSPAAFLGHAVHLQWRLHDKIARQEPKLGEIVAFRNVIPSIPVDSAVDEFSIQALISQLGHRLRYEPAAIVYNRGPSTVRDFLRQRRRIYAGHLRVRADQSYSAATMSGWRVLRALWRSGSFTTPRAAIWSIGTIGLEATARALGTYDYLRHRSQHVWGMCDTTKQDIADGARAYTQNNVAVFHIVNFHQQQCEIGLHASRKLTRAVASEIKRHLGVDAILTIRHSGSIIALLPFDRETTDRTAQELVERFDTAPFQFNGRGATANIALTCGIIAFQQTGAPLAISVPARMNETPATSIAI